MPQILDNVAVVMASLPTQVLANNSTVTTINGGVIYVTCPAGGVTGIRFSAGTYLGQTIAVINRSTTDVSGGTVSFATPATSLVGDADAAGRISEINAGYGRGFIWTGTYWLGEYTI